MTQAHPDEIIAALSSAATDSLIIHGDVPPGGTVEPVTLRVFYRATYTDGTTEIREATWCLDHPAVIPHSSSAA